MRVSVRQFPIKAMLADDDFAAYESFVSSVMKREDYYTAAQLKRYIISGYVSAWWVKAPDGDIIGWCGLNHYNKKRARTWNFLGVAVAPDYRHTSLALRLIRHVLKEGGDERDASVYIQPGVGTEKLMEPLGFKPVEAKGPWVMYVRAARKRVVCS